jgi:UrcA family protein
MKKTNVLGTVALLVFGLGAAASAIAASPSQFENRAVSVSFADLNIQNPAGAKVLYTRLRNAAESVCNLESYSDTGSLSRLAKAKQCYFEALDKAVSKIDSDALHKIHES